MRCMCLNSVGEFTGLSSDGNLAGSILFSMIRSIVGKYKDLVAIYRMVQLTASKQFDFYREVCELLCLTSFNLVLISVKC